MDKFEHGGNVYRHAGCVDFSANLNPLGMPAAARQALASCAEACQAYPDPYVSELTEALARFEDVPGEWVVPCAGATDAFYRLCQVLAPRAGLVADPCYSGYEQALGQVGAQVLHVALSKRRSFEAGSELVDAVTGDVDVVFVANPNNPTGRPLSRDVLVGLLEAAQAAGAVVVVDECFVDLSSALRSNDLLEAWPNLVVVKALTKSHCLAGLRVGHALTANQGLAQRLRAAGQPWAVSVPAQLAGVASLGDMDHLRRSLDLVGAERKRLEAGLAALGLKVVPGSANFLLFEGPGGLVEPLLDRGILVRPCDNFCGLGSRWYRMAVRTPEQNDLLLQAMGEVLA